MSEATPLLEVLDVTVTYDAGRGRRVHAVSGASFRLLPGEALGLVGESGCGKSSLARAVLQLPPPDRGKVRFAGEDLGRLSGELLRRLRPRMQMIFQDSLASLNPRRKVGESVCDPLAIIGECDRKERRSRAKEMLATVGLDPEATFHRRPHQLSGGQCQRACIARALISKPELLVCDEPVSSLDVSVQAQILNLLERMRALFKLSMLFISHDLAVVKNVSDRIAVMYSGKLREIAPSSELYGKPAHPYTALLLSAVTSPSLPSFFESRDSESAGGEPPSLFAPPAGCPFHSRCPGKREICLEAEPPMRVVVPGREVACHFPLHTKKTPE